MKIISLTLFTVFTLIAANCSSSNSAVPSATAADRQAAETALSNGDYATAIAKADVVISAGDASNDDKRAAYQVKGQAILGANNVSTASVATAVQANTLPQTALWSHVPSSINLASATTAADSLNAASALAAGIVISRTAVATSESTSLARLVANLTVVAKLVENVYSLGTTGVTLGADYTIESSLDYLFPATGHGVAYYMATVMAVAPNCGLSSEATATLAKVNAVITNWGLIHTAIKGGAAYQSSNGAITSASTSIEIKEAVDWEVIFSSVF